IPELPIGFQQVIFRAMAKNPSQRYQDAKAMLNDLEKLEQNPATVFPYPKEYRMPGRKPQTKKGLRGFLRSMYPDDEETYLHVRNSQLALVCGLLLSVLVVLAGIGTMVAVVSNLYQEYVNVPQYVGMSYDDIEANYDVAKNFRFNIQYEFDSSVESGVVLEQSPNSGESVVSGSEITLVISKGGRNIAVPELAGKTETQAIAALKNVGLTYFRKAEVGSAAIDEGIVLRCEPAAGTEVTEGTVVTIYVNVQAAVTEAIMPKLLGSTKENAITALYKKGITNVSINEVFSQTVPAGQVMEQSHPADSLVSLSQTVTITVSKGVEIIEETPPQEGTEPQE
ncbi:MAG: PASTA domain-containing protein, partial [Clostridia bacterium]|nr:PASTA domain-containing protein [Clostridia bacterium]